MITQMLLNISKLTLALHPGEGPLLKLRLQGANPFDDTPFDALLGKRVTVEGIAGSGTPNLFIEKLSDITVLGPSPRPRNRPPQP